MKTYLKYLLTGIVVFLAAVMIFFKYQDYITNPWTRDGQVRAEVVQVASRVSGPVINLPIKDNQFVQAGDLLFEVDPRTYKAALDQAKAQLDKAKSNYLALEKQVEAARAQVKVSEASVMQAMSTIKELDSQIEKNKSEFERQQEMLPQRATSQKSLERAKANYSVSLEKRKGSLASMIQSKAALSQSEASLAEALANLGAPGDANASIRSAQADVDQAELNFEFTKIRSPVAGYITNLNIRLGTQAVANQPILALVDTNSFWVHGYFKETLVGKITPGDKASVTLMTYPNKPLEGYVDSLGWGIAQQDGSTGFELLPTISPTFEWIRLAQRVPVRIHLLDIPESIDLRVGTTASVLVKTGSNHLDTK